MYVDINKVEVILRVGTGGVESESGGGVRVGVRAVKEATKLKLSC